MAIGGLGGGDGGASPAGDHREVGVAEAVRLLRDAGWTCCGEWLVMGDADGDRDAGDELTVELVQFGVFDRPDNQIAAEGQAGHQEHRRRQEAGP